ncbi:MAG: hypothetical protein PVJ73_19785, partial [Acidobacteriota bacterium]
MGTSRSRSSRRLTRPFSRATRVALLLPCLITIVWGAAEGADAPFAPARLQVEYSDTPLGIDVEAPRFSWQMRGPGDQRGHSQSAYRIVVTHPEDSVVWDSAKVASDVSLAIPYAGVRLDASTRYAWSLTVWDQNGDVASESSWFETGLMNPDPDLSAWDGATWIGGGDDDLVLY